MVSTGMLCASRVGPFRNIHDEDASMYFWFFFFFFSAFITAGIRFLVLGRAMPVRQNAGPPATTPCPRCQHIDDALLPPSLSPSSESKPCPEELLAGAKRRMSQKPTIPRFAICTTLAILNILAMVLMAFANQSLLYCGSEVTAETPIAKQQQTKDAVLIWFVYALSAAWASSGILCWAMWMRNLWGVQKQRRGGRFDLTLAPSLYLELRQLLWQFCLSQLYRFC